MTEKLYYKDSRIFEFSAKVTDIKEEKGIYRIYLDRTAFFPEGGGQPGDEGKIGNAVIFDTVEKDGEIAHFSKTKPDFPVNAPVFCAVDKKLRFMRMQAHSGEHIVSGVAHNLFCAENVGFHMIDGVMTVDLDKPLSKEQIKELEFAANEWVWKNVKITAEILPPEELEKITYRSKLDLKENVRIVTIEGCDACACCAPHLSSTGEIGIIKILSSVSHRGGVRMTVICGEKAYSDYFSKHKDIAEISALLKAPVDKTVEAVNELLDKVNAEKQKVFEQKQKLYNRIFNGLDFSDKNIVLFEEKFSPDELRELADICKAKTKAVFAVFSGDDNYGYAFAVSSNTVKLKQYMPAIKSALNAAGGGRDEMLQGRVAATKAETEEFFSNFEV